jgi:hypothetical protein
MLSGARRTGASPARVTRTPTLWAFWAVTGFLAEQPVDHVREHGAYHQSVAVAGNDAELRGAARRARLGRQSLDTGRLCDRVQFTHDGEERRHPRRGRRR